MSSMLPPDVLEQKGGAGVLQGLLMHLEGAGVGASCRSCLLAPFKINGGVVAAQCWCAAAASAADVGGRRDASIKLERTGHKSLAVLVRLRGCCGRFFSAGMRHGVSGFVRQTACGNSALQGCSSKLWTAT